MTSPEGGPGRTGRARAERGGGAVPMGAPGARASNGRLSAFVWSPAGVFLTAALLAIVVHLPALRNGFVFDDHYELDYNPVFKEPFSIRALLLTEYWGAGSNTGFYRPVPVLLQRILFAWVGNAPLPYHLLVLLSHALLAGLLAWFIAARFRMPRGALLAGALFAVHTAHAETVAVSYGLKEVLAALFGFAALVVLTGWREDRPWRRLGRLSISGGCVALAILSKESSVTVPAALVAADLLRGAPFRGWFDALRLNGRAAVFHAAFLAGAVIAALSMRLPVVGQGIGKSAFQNPMIDMALPSRLLMGLRVAGRYATFLAWPVRFTPSYTAGTIPTPGFPLAPDILLGAVLLILLGAAVLLAHRLQPPAGIGAVWAGATYLIASSLVYPLGTLMSERFLYLPSLGLALMLAPVADRLLRRDPSASPPSRPRAAAPFAGAATVAALSLLTFVRTPVYGDDATLMHAARRWYPNGVVVRMANSDELTSAGRYDESEKELLRILADYPGVPRVEEHLAMNAAARGDRQAALAYWERSIRHPDADVGTYHAYAEALFEAGRTEAAIRALSAGIRSGKGAFMSLARARELRGVLLLRQGDAVQGLADLRVAVAVYPQLTAAWEDLGKALQKTGDSAGAESAFRRAVESAPARKDPNLLLGRLLLAQRRGPEAAPFLQAATAADPADLQARSDLATAFMQSRQIDRARPIFVEILQQDPRHLVALATLGSIEESEGRPGEALSLYHRFLAADPTESPMTRDVRARAERLRGGP